MRPSVAALLITEGLGSFRSNRSSDHSRFRLQGFIPLPKSTNKSRIYSNTNIFDFELTNDEVAHLDTLDKCESFR